MAFVSHLPVLCTKLEVLLLGDTTEYCMYTQEELKAVKRSTKQRQGGMAEGKTDERGHNMIEKEALG